MQDYRKMVHMQHRFTTIKQLLTADVVILYSDQDLSEGHTDCFEAGFAKGHGFCHLPTTVLPCFGDLTTG